ncbi:MAG: methionine synthase [Alphaproteobacteria bacterium]|nr:methionine synthase [Alphaproteobacteria bacterium]
MEISRERILTTHMGSLPRPAALADLLIRQDNGEIVDAAALDAEIVGAIDRVVEYQLASGIDIANDGEMPRVGFQTYVGSRMSGFGGEGRRPEPTEITLFPEWAKMIKARRPPRARMYNAPAALSEVRYEDLSGIAEECELFRRALAGRDDRLTECFMTAASPGIVATTMMNHYYDSHEDYLFALASGLAKEYRYSIEAGFLLQIDAPDLAMERACFFQGQSLAEFQDSVALHVAAINTALDGIPPEKVRLHCCWGNRDGPHTEDVALGDILPLLLEAKVGGLCLPFANPRHAHEVEVLRAQPLPPEMVLVTGAVESTSNYVEHPEVVAERIVRAVDALGDRERVIAGVDCGFGTFAGYSLVAEDVVWAKLEALGAGARLASDRLWS